MGSANWLWFIFFIAVVGLARSRPRYFRHPAFQLLRVFLPSWRFFDEVGEMPALFLRTGSAPETLGAWLLPQPRRRRRWWALLFNSEGNLILAEQSLLERLLSEIEESPGIDSSVSYQLVQRLALLKAKNIGTAHFYQFKISLPESGDVLISPILGME